MAHCFLVGSQWEKSHQVIGRMTLININDCGYVPTTIQALYIRLSPDPSYHLARQVALFSSFKWGKLRLPEFKSLTQGPTTREWQSMIPFPRSWWSISRKTETTSWRMNKGWCWDRMEKWDWWAASEARKTRCRPRLCPTFLWWQRSCWMSLEFISNMRVLNWILFPEVTSGSVVLWFSMFVILYKASLGPGSMSLNPFFMWNLILSISSWDFPECPYPLSRLNCSSVTGPLSYCSHLPSVSSVDCKPLVGRDWDWSLLFPCMLPQTVHTFVEIFVLLTV